MLFAPLALQLALAPLALALAPPLSRLSIEKGTVASAHRRHDSPADTSLSTYMRRDPTELALVLKNRLPAGLLDVKGVMPGDAMVVTPRRVYFGPTALGLWVQPKLEVKVMERKTGRLVVEGAASAASGSHDAAVGLWLAHASVQTTCTWIEEKIQHLAGDTVPCLCLKSKVCIEVRREQASVQGRRQRLLNKMMLWLIPPMLIRRVCRLAVNAALADVQKAVASALMDDYEDWSVAPSRPAVAPAVA